MNYYATPNRQTMTQNKIDLKKCKVISNRIIAPNVHILEFEKNGNFISGQVVAIAISDNDSPRLYSLISEENAPTFKILFDIYLTGELTPLLAKLKKNDALYCSTPFGKFIDNETEAVWIATGTGIAPFISMTLSGKHNNKKLIHGARTLNNFYKERLFAEKLKDNYLRFCTTEQKEGIFHGRLTNWLKETSLQTDIKYYLCGNSQMVVDVRDILVSKGVPFNNIIAEIYF